MMIICIVLLLAHFAAETVFLLLLLHARKTEPRPAAKVAVAEQTLSAEQQAFRQLLRYSPEIAYGVSSMTQEE